MAGAEERPEGGAPFVRLQHQAFFEVLQHDEDTREWLAARAGLLVLRHVVAWSDSAGGSPPIGAEEAGVAAAVAALPVNDPERTALQGVLDAIGRNAPTARRRGPAHRGATRRAAVVEPVASALIAYGDTLVAQSAWALAADVFTTVWDTRAAPDGRLGGGADPRDADDPDEDSGADPTVSAASALAALNLAMCYRMLGRAADAADAYGAASAAAIHCRDPLVGESVRLGAQLGAAEMAADRGDFDDADRRLIAVVSAAASHAHLAEIQSHARRSQAAVRAARRAP